MLEILAKKYLIYKMRKNKMSKYNMIISVSGVRYNKIKEGE